MRGRRSDPSTVHDDSVRRLAPLAVLTLAILFAGPASAQQIQAWQLARGGFGEWTWGPRVADQAALDAITGAPGECRALVDSGASCCWSMDLDDWVCGGGGSDDQTAAEVPITDAAGYYTATHVEGALLELLDPAGDGRNWQVGEQSLDYVDATEAGALHVNADGWEIRSENTGELGVFVGVASDEFGLQITAPAAFLNATEIVLDDDARLTDARTPTGSAGGDLTGTYPNPTIDANAVALGADTTGTYVSGATAGGGLVLTGAEGGSLGMRTDCATDEVAAWDGDSWECGGGGASPAGSGSELQYRSDATTFGAVTDSSVSGANITLGAAVTLKPGAWVEQTFFGGNGLELRNAAGTASASLAVRDLMLGAPSSNGTAPRAMWRSFNDDLWVASNFVVYWSDTPGAASSRDTSIRKTHPGVVAFGGGTSSAAGAGHAPPMDNPPVTCGNADTFGVFYTDSSGAFCWCDGTDWHVAAGVGGACS